MSTAEVKRRKKMHKKWFRARYLQRMSVALALLVQAGLIFYLLYSGSRLSEILSATLSVVSIVTAMLIAARNDNDEIRLLWILCILIFPVFGGLMYLLFHFQSSTKRFRSVSNAIAENTRSSFFMKDSVLESACSLYPEYSSSMKYLEGYAGFPVYSNSETKYLSPGEVKFEYMISEFRKAEHYIFLEYFIIEEGIMWNTLLDILIEKAAQGVDIRLIYDDIGCFLTLPKDYPEKLEKLGIRCCIFNRFRPFWVSEQNNRDHRKIAVIDGRVAFTGGINLADEYINAYEKYGHWKDASVMVRGDAAWSFTVMFMQMWMLCKMEYEPIEGFYPEGGYADVNGGGGFVQPYTDSPLDSENVGEQVYLQIINGAKKYLYINTPYLVIDENLLTALTLAAKSGVDVRIVTPHKWDKLFVHITTRSYYLDLIRAGIKIYEYSGGFIHSKTFVADDSVATVGTTNLDFRSLFLHFECGIKMIGGDGVAEVRNDFLKTLEVCQPISEKDCRSGIAVGFLQKILRIFAPMM